MMLSDQARLLFASLVCITIAGVIVTSRALMTDAAATSARSHETTGHLQDIDVRAEPFWSSPDRAVSLHATVAGDDRWVCPRIRGNTRQPLCRRFSAPVVAACRRESDLLMVLSDGDIHRVNYALISTDGRFSPAYHQKKPLDLVDAWMPASGCTGDVELPRVIAMNSDRAVMQFDQASWRRID